MTQTAVSSTERAHRATKRYIYAWGDGRAEGNAQMRDLLGGKGAGLAEMTIAGLPVPPGFTITTEACNDYFAAGEKLPAGLWDDVQEAVHEVERETGKGFGDPANPLLVSVRSGAKFSMPGMMDTVLNLGLNEQTLQGLIALTGNERFGWDAYRRFIQMFGRIVMDVDGTKFDEALEAKKHARGVTAGHGAHGRRPARAGDRVPRDRPARDAAAPSPRIPGSSSTWPSRRSSPPGSASAPTTTATARRSPHDLGTAVNVVTMVFGNMGDDSGTGVAFTRDPNTGEQQLYGEYLTNAQGEDVVAGIRTRAEDRPDADRHAGGLRRVPAHRPAAREALPRRPGPRVHDRARPAVHAPDALGQADRRGGREDRGRHGRRGPDLHGRRPSAGSSPRRSTSCCATSSTRTPRQSAKRVAKGLNASPGAAVGRAVFDADDAVAWVEKGEKVILVRVETSPDDFHGMAVAQGIITARGGATSHAAVVARQIGKPCVAGCAELVVDYRTKSARVDRLGAELQGRRLAEPRRFDRRALPRPAADRQRPLRGPGRPPEAARLGGPVGAACRCGPTRTSRRRPRRPAPTARWASASAAPSTCSARASGWRSCAARSWSPTRRPGPRRSATPARRSTPTSSDAVDTFDAAMAKLEKLQQGDFEGIFRAMDGLPVVIRLIDPPLHEFLPNLEEQLVKVTRQEDAGDASTKRTASCWRPSARCTSRTRCWACAAAAWG